MPATTTEPILDAVKALTPSIAARAEEIERARRLPPTWWTNCSPRAASGCWCPAATAAPSWTCPFRCRSSRSWPAPMPPWPGRDDRVGGSRPVQDASPRQLRRALRRRPRCDHGRPCAKPTGVATPVEGGYRVTGQWAFASGCQHAHWFVGHCVVDDGREPPVRMMVLPPSDVEIKDTWSVSGLCGTGSHDVVANGAFVPDELSFVVFGSEPSVDVPPLRIPELTRAAIQIASVTIGVARGALDEILALAIDKTPAFAEGPLASNPLFQNQFGEAETQLRAARTALRAEADIVWAKAQAGSPFTPEDRAHVRGTTTWVARTAAAIVNTAYQAGGSSSIYTSNPLQRRLRDAHALTQHFTMKADTFTKVGAVLAGQEVDLTLF